MPQPSSIAVQVGGSGAATAGSGLGDLRREAGKDSQGLGMVAAGSLDLASHPDPRPRGGIRPESLKKPGYWRPEPCGVARFSL